MTRLDWTHGPNKCQFWAKGFSLLKTYLIVHQFPSNSQPIWRVASLEWVGQFMYVFFLIWRLCIDLSFDTRYPSYRILSIPALHVTRVTASMSREARWWPSFWLVTAFEYPSLIGQLSWLHPNPNLNLRYQLEPPGEGTPEGRPGRMHFADGLYFIWWQRCEALVLRLGKWGDGRDGKTWKSLTERRMLNYIQFIICMIWRYAMNATSGSGWEICKSRVNLRNLQRQYPSC